MTVAANDRRSGPYTAVADQTVFDFDFPIRGVGDLVVTRRRAGADTVLAYPAAWTLAPGSLDNPLGGQVVLTAGAAAGDELVLEGARAAARTTAFADTRKIGGPALNGEFDHIQVQLQELRRTAERSLPRDAFADAYQAGGRRLEGLGAPVEAADAATKAYVMDAVSGGVMSELEDLVTAAAASADAAEGSADAAAASADAAEGSADAAAASADAAEGSADAADGSADAAASAQAAAESAADAAALSAGIYPDEPTGRAAVADGVIFRAVGDSATASIDIWQRVDAGSSNLLRSFPSLHVIDALIASESALAVLLAADSRRAALDRRTTDDLEYQLDYYASSGTLGSDGADGLGRSSPKATIAGLLGLTPGPSHAIGLVSGSAWREMLKPAGAVKRIRGVGDEAPPVLDGAAVLSAGAFTASAHGDAGGVVYEVTLTRDAAGVYVSGDTYMLWEDGAWLARKTSVAACAATPGTFYVPQPNAQATPSLAYVHPFGSTDPTSDGKVYEYSARSSGLELAHANKVIAEGVHVRRGSSAYGAATGGRDAIFRRVLSAQGGKHNFVVKSGLLEDCIAFDAEIGRSVLPDGGLIPFTAYENNPSGRDYTLRRCMAIFPAGRVNGQATHAHGSTGTPGYHRIGRFEAFLSLRGGMLAGMSEQQYMTDACALDVAKAISFGPVSDPVVCRRALVRQGVFSSNSGTLHLPSAGGAPGHALEIADCAVFIPATAGASARGIQVDLAGTISAIHHNVLHLKASSDHATVSAAAAGSELKHNIFVMDKSGTQRWIVVGPNVACDYNVYINVNANTHYWQDEATGTAFSLSEWRSESGHDINSVLLNAAQAATLFLNGVAGIEDGDFRLNPACTLTFVDGTPIVGNAGPREHYNWNRRRVEPGPPAAWPTPPETEAECALYIADPWAWDFYP